MPTSFTLYANPPTGSATSIQLHGGTVYELAMNDVTGPRFTPLRPPSRPIWGGSGFADGADLVGVSFDNVTETIPLQIKGASVDAIIASKRDLERLFYLGSKTRPLVAAFQPNAATNAQYTEVYHAELQEGTEFINEEAGRLVMRAQLTWTRAPWWVGSTRATAINAALLDNTSSGGTNHVTWGSSLSGDLIYRGQPTALDIASNAGTWTSGSNIRSIMLATINGAPSYLSRANAISTASTTGITVGSYSDATAGVATVGSAGLETRIIGRFSGTIGNLEVRVSVYYGASPNTGALVYQSEWETPTAGTARAMVDFGGFTLPPNTQRGPTSAAGIRIQPEARATSGTATATWDALEILQCYTFCKVESTVFITGGNGATGCRVLVLSVENATNPTSYAQVYRAPKLAWFYNATTMDVPRLEGTPPIAIQGANLWAAWLTNGTYTTSDQVSVSGFHAPLYATLRGGG